VTDIDLTQLFDESTSLAEGALTIPGYNAGVSANPARTRPIDGRIQ